LPPAKKPEQRWQFSEGTTRAMRDQAKDSAMINPLAGCREPRARNLYAAQPTAATQSRRVSTEEQITPDQRANNRTEKSIDAFGSLI